MSLKGDSMGRLIHEDLHAPECNGKEYSCCRPVVRRVYNEGLIEEVVEVVWMAWCGGQSGCGAATWEYV